MAWIKLINRDTGKTFYANSDCMVQVNQVFDIYNEKAESVVIVFTTGDYVSVNGHPETIVEAIKDGRG